MVWRLTPNNSATYSCVNFFSIRAALILLPISCSMPLYLPCTFIVGKTPYIVYQMAFTSLIMCVKILWQPHKNQFSALQLRILFGLIFYWLSIFIYFPLEPCHNTKLAKRAYNCFFVNLLLATWANNIFFTFYIFHLFITPLQHPTW